MTGPIALPTSTKMRRLLLIFLLCLPLSAQIQNFFGANASGTWGSLLQHTNGTCSANPCTTTHTSTTAGSLLVMWSFSLFNGTGGTTGLAMTATSGDSTWTRCPNSFTNSISNNNTYGINCFYILSAAGGATSFTTTWLERGPSGPTSTFITNELYEVSYTGTAYYNTGNATRDDNTTCTTCTDTPAGLLNEGNSIVMQAASTAVAVSSVSSPYATNLDIVNNGASGLRIGVSIASPLAQYSYAKPTWTKGGNSASNFYATAAFSLTPPAYPTYDYYQNWSTCTNNSAPTAVCMGSSTITGNITLSGTSSVDVGSLGAGMLVTSSSGPSSSLPKPYIVNGTINSGSGGLSLYCPTAVATHCGSILQQFTQGDFSTIGFTFQTNCNYLLVSPNTDCGAVGGLFGSGGTFAVLHIDALVAQGSICYEVANNSCQIGGTIADTNCISTPCRVNMQGSNASGGTYAITICNDTTGAVLGAWTKTGQTGTPEITKVEPGFSGQEPAYTSFNYYWRNIVVSVSGAISTSSCF